MVHLSKTRSGVGGQGPRHTGVTVVSNQPQSTTKPVTLPQATRANKLEDVNDTEGTFSDDQSAWMRS